VSFSAELRAHLRVVDRDQIAAGAVQRVEKRPASPVQLPDDTDR